MRLAWTLSPLLLAALWWLRGVRLEPGVAVPEEPAQFAWQAPGWERNGFRILPLARYDIRARLIGREYYWVDHGAHLSPVDLVLAWGRMSDQAVLDRLWWSQGGRFLHWRAGSGGWPLPFDELNAHSANVHVIPATPGVLDTIRWVRPGSTVRLGGFLVEVESPQGSRWRSSLSRTDTGAGACELMWVEKAVRE